MTWTHKHSSYFVSLQNLSCLRYDNQQIEVTDVAKKCSTFKNRSSIANFLERWWSLSLSTIRLKILDKSVLHMSEGNDMKISFSNLWWGDVLRDRSCQNWDVFFFPPSKNDQKQIWELSSKGNGRFASSEECDITMSVVVVRYRRRYDCIRKGISEM